MKRREFMKKLAAGLAGLSVPVAAIRVCKPGRLLAAPEGPSTKRWIFQVDTYACTGCGLCVRACKLENEVPYDAAVSRTWVERYVVTKEGKTFTDSPNGGRDGFTDPAIDLGEGKQREIKPEEIEKAFFVPKLCNQCDNPPCVQVCPVGATYQTADGVVLIDRKWCIGCGYCIMACPYGVRFFHPTYHVAEKCNFCYHRISKGMKPACVEACPFGARLIGNGKDPDDPVTKNVETTRVNVLKEEYGTKPQVYYVGLSREVK